MAQALGRRTLTDNQGRYLLENVPAGAIRLLVRSVGYRPSTIVVKGVPGATVRTDIRLVAVTFRLDSITVTGRTEQQPHGSGLEALEERRRRGFGRFVDSTVLRQSEGLELGTVIRRAGVEVKDDRALGRMRCPMTVYLDGVRVKNPPPLNAFSVFGIAGIEIYASVAQIPPDFDALDQRCGVLVLWTRK